MKNLLKRSLHDLLLMIDDLRSNIILQIYKDYKEIFHYAAGSSKNHQAWKGGYAYHVTECLRINEVVYDSLSSLRPLVFQKSSAAIILFLHDVEKAFRYGPINNTECVLYQEKVKNGYQWDLVKWDVINGFKRNYGLKLMPDEMNALEFCHGEGDKYQKNRRVYSPLAAHVHHCDNISARIWFNEGRNLSNFSINK